MRKRLMTYLMIIPAILLLMALWLRWREPGMIYYPTREIDRTPDQLGWKYEDVYLTTADGVRINGWFIPAPQPQTPNPQHPTPTLLFFHGNAGNISHRLEKLAIMRDLGANVFILDYRGYGRSEGVPNEPGTYCDAQAAYDYLTGGAPGGRALPPQSIVVYGESLGSAVAVDLAAKKACGGVIIEEPFTSIADVGQRMFPFLPIRLLVRNKYDALSKIGRVNVPLLIFHSRDDEYFPIRHAERLLAAAREPKHLIELRGGHNDAFLTSAETYRNALKDFLARLAEATPP